MQHKTLFGMLKKTYELSYVDYNSNLDGHEKELQECIKTNGWQPIDEVVWEWQLGSTDDSVDCILEELKRGIDRKVMGRFEFDVEMFVSKNYDNLREEIQNRDISTFLKDLLRNTRDLVAFYSTGWSCGETCFIGEDGYKELKRDIRKELGLKRGEYDKELNELIANAGYGGELVVYFTTNIDEFITYDNNPNMIEFSNPHIALIDTSNGSGSDVKLKGHKFSLPFDRDNIYLDKTIKYNYTYEVCGMSGNWCEDTGVHLFTKKTRKQANKSVIGDRQKRDDKLAEVFKSGKCTAGDMDYSRHHHMVYINEFPCGTHCLDCGTFFID